jgi:voltage-gated potassium channel
MNFELEPRLRPSDDDGWRLAAFRVIFEHDTRGGWLFDVALIAAILASVLITMLDSVASLHARYGDVFYVLEWAFTVAFTAEYVARLLVVNQPLRYARSFFGIVDLLAVLPTWLSLLFPGSQYLLVVRLLRILRVFRILKLARYVSEAGVLMSAMRRSSRKIFVFLFAIMTVVTVFGALMYVVEGPEHGFDSIPLGIYWAIVTVGTVGFGDIAPATGLGRFLASILILFGYGLIAVPTGIYTAELAQGLFNRRDQRRCEACRLVGHEPDAAHCRSCGGALPGPDAAPAAGAARRDG